MENLEEGFILFTDPRHPGRQFLFASQESFHSLVPVNMETQFTAWCWACRRAQAGIRMLVIHTNAAFFLLSHLTHTHTGLLPFGVAPNLKANHVWELSCAGLN